MGITPTSLGSSANFAKLTGQFAYYKQIHSVVYANSIRLGFAKAFAGSFVPTSQLYFSGGGSSLRGFPINEAGPVRYVPFCSAGQTTNCPQVPVPIGGNQLFIFNSEVRYPIPIMKNLGGVVFYDGGNVYRRVNFPDFINNYTILHARTSFDDGDAPEDARRHLLRLWLDAPIRPVHPYIRSRGILQVAGRTPSFDWNSIAAVRH